MIYPGAMKKLSIAACVLSLSIAAPVFACPGMESHDEAPRTADKTEKKETEKPAPKDTAKKDAPKPAPKPAPTPKTAQK